MARNVMKHIVHKWGGNILSIHEGIGPPIRRPNQSWLGQNPKFRREQKCDGTPNLCGDEF